MTYRLPTLAVLILLLIPTFEAMAAQQGLQPLSAETPEIHAQRLPATPPRIDGRLDEEIWQTAAPADSFVQRQPHAGAAASEPSEAWVYFDDEAIYVGMRLYDRNPGAIAAPLLPRDGGADHSDWAYVMLDSNADRRTAFVFSLNPRGVQKDWFISDDEDEDLTWDGVWEGSAQLVEDGWTAEFRIPLSQLRYGRDQASWGLNLGRWIAREREYSFWSPWLPDHPGYVSRFGRLSGLQGLAAPRRLELMPFILTRLLSAPGEAGDPFHDRHDLTGSAGLDLKYGITSNLTLTATINPDFGQVEGDPAVVNLTAFETRFAERRPFFLEGTSIFDFEGGEVFYTRRIGRAPQGSAGASALFADEPEAASILGAVKLSGRTSAGWSVGLLNALTERATARLMTVDGEFREAVVEPMTNHGVVRVAKDFREGGSTLGGIFTSTHRWIDDEGLQILPSNATVGGVDGRHRFGGNGYEVRGWIAGSRVEGSREAMQRLQRLSSRYFQRPDAGHLELDPERTSLEGYSAGLNLAKRGGNWRWSADGTVISPGFEINDLGFQQVADRLSQQIRVQYNSYEPGSFFRRWDLSLTERSEWTFGGERVDAGATLFSNYELSNYWNGFAQIMRRTDALSPTALRGGPALHLPGFWRPVLRVQTDRRRPVTSDLFVNLRLGDAPDDRSASISSSVRWRSPSLEISAGPSFYSVRYPWQYVSQQVVEGEARYIVGRLQQSEASLRLRLSYVFAPRLSLEFFAEPFVSSVRFDRFMEVDDPRARDAGARFRRFSGGDPQLDPESNRYRAAVNGSDAVIEFSNPDGTLRSFRSNAVVRWEYRPGSSLYLVWSQRRSHALADGSFELGDGLRDLSGVAPTNVLALKVSYRFSP